MKSLSICWFRRDLRLYDNHALYEALKSGNEVLGVYIFDKTLLKLVENSSDPRITFIYRTLEELQRQLVSMGSNLLVIYDDLRGAFEELNKRYDIKSVYANIEYEPYSLKRDRQISHYLKSKHIDFYLFKDEVIFEKDEIIKSDGTHYLIFSSYERVWLRRLS